MHVTKKQYFSNSGGKAMKTGKQLQINKASPKMISKKLDIVINVIGTLLIFGVTIYGIVTFAQIIHQSTNPTQWETEVSQERLASALSFTDIISPITPETYVSS